jgi:hypothetical protein
MGKNIFAKNIKKYLINKLFDRLKQDHLMMNEKRY